MLIKQGKYSQLTEYDNLSKDDLVDCLLKRYNYFAKLEKHEETLKLCEAIFKLDKDNEIGLGHKTCALMRSDKYEDALKCCNHAIELYPNNWRFYMFKSDILCFGFDDYEESSIYLEKWQEIKINNEKIKK